MEELMYNLREGVEALAPPLGLTFREVIGWILGLLAFLVILNIFSSLDRGLTGKDFRYFDRQYRDLANKLNELQKKLDNLQKSNNN